MFAQISSRFFADEKESDEKGKKHYETKKNSRNRPLGSLCVFEVWLRMKGRARQNRSATATGVRRSEKSFIFRIPAAHLLAISKKFHPFSPGRSLKARLVENGIVNPFAILSISLTAIKVMSYEIDCPHKIVSSPFCGPEAYIHPVLGSAKQMTVNALFRVTLSIRRYREVQIYASGILTRRANIRDCDYRKPIWLNFMIKL